VDYIQKTENGIILAGTPVVPVDGLFAFLFVFYGNPDHNIYVLIAVERTMKRENTPLTRPPKNVGCAVHTAIIVIGRMCFSP